MAQHGPITITGYHDGVRKTALPAPVQVEHLPTRNDMLMLVGVEADPVYRLPVGDHTLCRTCFPCREPIDNRITPGA